MKVKLALIAVRIAEAVAIKLAMDAYEFAKKKHKEYRNANTSS